MNSLKLLFLAIIGSVAVAGGQAASWDPPTFAREDTLEFPTVGPDEGEHWSRVWIVALEDKLYVRVVVGQPRAPFADLGMKTAAVFKIQEPIT